MKSITVHGIDEKTEKLIKKRAKSEGTSVNKVMKKDNREEFLDLFGIWTEEEGKQFFKAIKDKGFAQKVR